MTDAQPETPAHPNQLAQVLLASDASSWVFTGSGVHVVASSHRWPRSPEAVQEMQAALGCGVPANSSGNPTISGWVRALLATATETDREGYLRRLRGVRIASGMNDTSGPDAAMVVDWQQPHGPARLPIMGGMRLKVTWHADRTVFLVCEALAAPTGLFDLYLVFGCDHDFEGVSRGHCYTVFTCKKCQHRYDIDSGD